MKKNREFIEKATHVHDIMEKGMIVIGVIGAISKVVRATIRRQTIKTAINGACSNAADAVKRCI